MKTVKDQMKIGCSAFSGKFLHFVGSSNFHKTFGTLRYEPSNERVECQLFAIYFEIFFDGVNILRIVCYFKILEAR